jgi:hypothetical protein
MGRKIIPQKDFYYLGDQIMCTNKEERFEVLGGQPQHLVKENVSSFVLHFGTTPLIYQCLWAFLIQFKVVIPKGGMPYHLPWALLFMKCYTSEQVLANMVGTTPKTFWKWIWPFVAEIARLEPIVMSKRIY